MPMDSYGYGLYSPSHGDQAPDFGSHSNPTQHATDFSQNESQMSFVTPSSKYLTASSTGRSMKDLEEQLTQLKKENFNLKLRIYFAEERKKILQGTEHTDELVEKIMKLQVEHQNLKTELSDKEDLIVQTAKAMESLEKGHETRMTELRRMHDAQVRQLQSKIEQLEVDVTYSRFKQEASNARSTNDAAATTVKNLEAQVSNLESKLSDSAQVIGNLESELCTSRATIATLESRLEDLEGELSSRSTRLGEVYAETRRVEDEKRKAEEEVRSLKSELSQMERNLHSKSDEVVRAKQDVCDKVLCSKRTEEEIKSLRKQLTNQTSRVDELTNTNAQLTAKLNSSNHSGALTSDRIEELTNRNAELTVRLDQCEASLRQDRGQVEELSRRLNEERQRTERVRGENKQLRRDNESLKEALSRAPSKCSTSSAPRPPSPSPSLHINISETSDSHHRLNEDYRQLNAKHNALYESFTETCKRLEKTDTEYKKALGVIRNMVKENKKNCHLVETLRDRVREVEERLQCDPAGGAAGDGGRQTHARGQPEGSNEVREEFTEKDIDLLEKQVLIEDYMKQISELSTKLQAYESAAHQTSSTNQKTSSAHTNSAHPNTTTNQNASPAPQDNDPTCLAALQLKSKTEEIERLNTELKKRTFNLQELVNTELWQKNREIEKLLRKSEKKAADLSVLRASLKEKESHLLYLQKEMSEMVAEINATQPGGTLHPDHRRLIDRVKALKDNVDCVSEDKDGLLGQLANLKVSLNMCDKQRREALQAASVLNRRLGELADFLESLISDSTSPDTALPLSGKRKLILRHAVEASRELSRTVGATFNLTECEEERNVPILPDYSEINFLSESDELADVTLEAEEGGRCKDEVIQQLRSQVHNLRDQVKQKDMEIASRTILSGDLSACEAFSEPDLVVSKARMGGVCESNVVSWPSSDSDSSEQDSTRVSKYKGKRHLRIEKSNELIKGLQERIDELSKLNVQLEKEKEMLEKKLTVQPSRRDQGTCVEDKHPTEGKQETTKLIEEFKDQKENNKMILNKLEHLESLYTLITNKDDLVKELELYNQAKSKVTNLESEIMMFKCKNTEMKEKLNQMKAEIKQYEKLTSELKQNLKEEKNKNEECCKKYEELKDENDNLQSQVCNLSADLENIKKDDDMRNKYEHTKSLLELTNEKLETLKIDYETVKKELSDRNEKYICDHRMLKQELELAEKSKQEISAQYEITKLELKSSNDYVTELKSHYEILLTQLSKSNETIDDLNSKLNQAKVDLEHSSNKLDLMNSNLSETQETLTQLKLNLNDEIHNSKLYKDENERLMNKISVMENNKRTWEKEINALRLTLKKYRENEEKEMSKHTELVCEMTRKIEEFKHERIQLNYDIRELKRKIEELTKEKEEMSRKFEETQEKVLKQNDRALQEIQNEMKVKLESANEKIVQKDDKLEQIEDLYKARERELRLKYSRRETELKRQLETLTLNNSEIILERARLANEKLRLQQEMRDKSGAVPLNVQILEQLKVQLEKRVDELEVSNVELEAKLASYGSGGKFSDHELTSGGEEGYPGSPRRSLCTPPPSPNRRGSSGSSPASPAQPCKLLSSLSSTKYLSLGRDIPSPDLGIDSDHGRVSNSETSDNPDKSSLAKLVEENSQLQRMLHKTRQALENTIKQLAAANRRKCQIERDICKQLHKTQHIIRKARVNIQSSESRERGEDAENIDPLAS